MGSIDLGYKNRVRFTLSHPIKGSLVIAEPFGWTDDEKEYSRHKKYHGIFTKFSNSLEFIEDGADFINEVRDAYNINAEITLLKEGLESFREFLNMSSSDSNSEPKK